MKKVAHDAAWYKSRAEFWRASASDLREHGEEKKAVQAMRTCHRMMARASNVGAVGGGTLAAPGEQAQGLPHGSNVRKKHVGTYSYLTVFTVRAVDHQRLELGLRDWALVRTDLLPIGLPVQTLLVRTPSREEVFDELRNWRIGTGLPFEPTYDPFTVGNVDPAAGLSR